MENFNEILIALCVFFGFVIAVLAILIIVLILKPGKISVGLRNSESDVEKELTVTVETVEKEEN